MHRSTVRAKAKKKAAKARLEKQADRTRAGTRATRLGRRPRAKPAPRCAELLVLPRAATTARHRSPIDIDSH